MSDVYYDPYDLEIDADPYPTYKRVRDEAPLYFNERLDFWGLSRFGDVEAALKDATRLSSAKGDILEVVKADPVMPPGVFINEDPPENTTSQASATARTATAWSAEAAELLAARPEVAETLITHRFALDDAVEAFRVASDRSTGAIRVVLET